MRAHQLRVRNSSYLGLCRCLIGRYSSGVQYSQLYFIVHADSFGHVMAYSCLLKWLESI